MNSKLVIASPEIGVNQMLTLNYQTLASAVCVVGHAPFQARVELAYEPSGGQMLEFEAFETWLRSISTMETTIEGLALIIHSKLLEVLGPDSNVQLILHATTQVHGPVMAQVNTLRF